ncbi:TssN family type VI secretion system protein [Niabella insulamsoli]|uniref:TssN family type VI secretion system protein n=1 Tax=Niabella insulamsoli TaxID=3144874 RepID=UPI0031FBB68D
MALKFFLIYAASLLGLSMIVMALIKPLSASFGNQGKKPLLFNIISSIIAAGAAFAATYLSQDLFTIFWSLSAVFLLFGIVFILLVHKKYFKARRDNRNKQLFAEVLFAVSIIFLCMAVFSSLQYFLKDKNFMFFPMLLSGLFFFIPILFLHTFDAAYSIPEPKYISWRYPEQTIDLPDEQEHEKLYVIGFVIAKTPEASKTYFRAKAPEYMLLGDLYYHFINDYNEQFSETPIVHHAPDSEAYGWLFRTKPRWYQFSRRLDPSLTVSHNKIKENTIIVCERSI